MQEYWLSGPVPEVPALLQPVAHTILQARREVDQIMDGFPQDRLWDRPAGLAAPGFHLRHMAGILDRLFTYARGEALNESRLAALASESVPDQSTVSQLLYNYHRQTDRALTQLKMTDPQSLEDLRFVGRRKLPSSVLGLLFHAAEHSMRHAGQLLVTVKIISGKPNFP